MIRVEPKLKSVAKTCPFLLQVVPSVNSGQMKERRSKERKKPKREEEKRKEIVFRF
jgi:hypothetical protein